MLDEHADVTLRGFPVMARTGQARKETGSAEDLEAELRRLLARARGVSESPEARTALDRFYECISRLRSAVERAQSTYASIILDMHKAADDLAGAIGVEPPRVSAKPKPLPAMAPHVNVPDGTVVTLRLPRVLTTFLEMDPPPELRKALEQKESRAKGPGFSDLVTLRGKEAAVMLDYLVSSRSRSQQYQNVNKAIAELEEALGLSRSDVRQGSR